MASPPEEEAPGPVGSGPGAAGDGRGEEAFDAALWRYTGYRMRRAWGVVQADMAEALRPVGLRNSTFSALAMVCTRPGLTQTELAQAIAVERPNLVVLLDELAARDLIRRERRESDRRSFALLPTAAGQKLFRRAQALNDAHEARLFAGFDAEERAALNRLLARVEGRE
ncbi:MarR family winged helix-turn-helix transcriptional regulator [Wenxinia saemankumensis]|uniref:DNA-binding transcriptional regulator, MarR family n=1 Tax=Wenxinia saemankumensis TaxID=1447782 RepID=A0A1M6AAH7_9RHOB|nr:MarR family winged helix-turn-helix transcriptional regulator [Wenxinia saemankumensis]SHI33460.1 DNA-binding transcriptional regulator, MarR family [Wenxinia saemankumensis]